MPDGEGYREVRRKRTVEREADQAQRFQFHLDA
jgi:hypothetical protein